MIADDRVRGYACPAQCTAEEGLGTGAVPFVPQENIDASPVLIDGAIQVPFLSATAAEHLIHVPPPSQPSPVAMDGLGQLRAEGLYPVEYRTGRDNDVALL